ncbi:hypothetical protein BC629DRAFT_1463401 [Irpex lacteus]|nr:hypothetical protein BC629DRAFT_1463401 [Irpex lacteus]
MVPWPASRLFGSANAKGNLKVSWPRRKHVVSLRRRRSFSIYALFCFNALSGRSMRKLSSHSHSLATYLIVLWLLIATANHVLGLANCNVRGRYNQR